MARCPTMGIAPARASQLLSRSQKNIKSARQARRKSGERLSRHLFERTFLAKARKSRCGHFVSFQACACGVRACDDAHNMTSLPVVAARALCRLSTCARSNSVVLLFDENASILATMGSCRELQSGVSMLGMRLASPLGCRWAGSRVPLPREASQRATNGRQAKRHSPEGPDDAARPLEALFSPSKGRGKGAKIPHKQVSHHIILSVLIIHYLDNTTHSYF